MHPDPEESVRALLDAERLDRDCATIFAIDPDGELMFVNAGWSRFAAENGGQPQIEEHWGVGANYFDALPGRLERFYRNLFRQAPRYREGTAPLMHRYQCSSPSLYREFSMLVYALPGERGYLVVNSLVVERPHDDHAEPPWPPDGARYRSDEGIVTQCAHCRRVQHRGAESRWDWVPAWVERPPPRTSHGICPVCLDHYFPQGEPLAGP